MAPKPTDAELRSRLTPEQYRVTQEGATEPAFSGEHYRNTRHGTYLCVVCGERPGSGWPSFREPASPGRVAEFDDRSLGMRRVEVRCAGCGAHLGHVFEDGPQRTGQRFGINSAALDFEPGTGA